MLDFISERAPITADYAPGEVQDVKLHDGSTIRLRKIGAGYDVHDRRAALNYLMERRHAGEIVTGLIYLEDTIRATCMTACRRWTFPLNQLGDADLVPGQAALDKINAGLRWLGRARRRAVSQGRDLQSAVGVMRAARLSADARP